MIDDEGGFKCEHMNYLEYDTCFPEEEEVSAMREQPERLWEVANAEEVSIMK